MRAGTCGGRVVKMVTVLQVPKTSRHGTLPTRSPWSDHPSLEFRESQQPLQLLPPRMVHAPTISILLADATQCEFSMARDHTSVTQNKFTMATWCLADGRNVDANCWAIVGASAPGHRHKPVKPRNGFAWASRDRRNRRSWIQSP